MPDKLVALRLRMVKDQIVARGIRDSRIVRAMGIIPRHKFVPYTRPRDAYGDGPLPIGQGQTISQPYITAYMTELLNLRPSDRVLEVGTGSGYQAALLSCVCKEVFSMEIIAAHSPQAKGRVERSNGTCQDRLVKELALRRITTCAAADRLLQNGFTGNLNEKFAVAPIEADDFTYSLLPI